MFFADDLVLFGYANQNQAAIINEILNKFCSLSGQEISRDKSRAYFSKNVKRTVVQEVCGALNIQATQNLGRYLGVPIIHGRNSNNLYHYLIDRMEKKLAGWKVGSLSMAGRVSLAMSALNSLPTYAMQTTLLPAEICEIIDRKIRSFIWGARDGERKLHLVNWETVCKPKNQGGLGLRSARELNMAYLMKLTWSVLKKPSELWAQVLTTKYMKRTINGLEPKKTKRWSSCWRGINASWEVFRGGLSWGIRNGRTTNFWKERWLDDGSVIEDSVTPPFGHGTRVIADYCNPTGEWNIDLLASLLPSQILQAVVGMTPPHHDLNDDIPVWNLEPNGKYSVKTGYLLAKELTNRDEQHLWKRIWKWEGSQRVRNFLWIAASGKMLTNAERVRRHLSSNSDCGICPGEAETCEHILRSCPMASQVWDKALNLEINDPFFTLSWEDWWESNLTNPMRKTVFGYTCWTLWKCRNERVFEGKLALVDSIFAKSSFWTDVSNSSFKEVRLLREDFKLQKRVAAICWKPAPAPSFTLNSDGSVDRPSGNASAGGVLRNWQGRSIDAFTANLGKCSITRAELTGIIIGMERAWNAGVRDLEIQTDSLTAVGLLNNAKATDHQHASLIVQFSSLLDRNWKVTLKHIFREANHLADALAEKGHEVNLGNHTFNCSETIIRYWESYDLAGGTELRRIAI
ncbi:Putative ribonuclease H protein At1g65750 [Linum perenne]